MFVPEVCMIRADCSDMERDLVLLQGVHLNFEGLSTFSNHSLTCWSLRSIFQLFHLLQFSYPCGKNVQCFPLCDKEKSSAKSTFGSNLATFFMYNVWAGKVGLFHYVVCKLLML